MKATLKMSVSPQKASRYSESRSWEKVNEALPMLHLFNKKGGDILYKVLYSAMSNAIHNDSAEKDDLSIHLLSVTQGPTYRRGRAVGRGRHHKILKRTSHVFIELTNV